MISQNQFLIARTDDQLRQRGQQFGRVQIRALATEAVLDLGQNAAAHAFLAGTQADQPDVGFNGSIQHRRRLRAHIVHAREGGNDQGHRRARGLGFAAALPTRLHRQRILADRNADVQRRAQFHAHRLHRLVQRGVFARLAGRGHPVGRQFHFVQTGNRCRQQIGNRFAHRQTRRSGGVQHRHRRAFAHGHGFAGETGEIGAGDGAIGHRHLPRTDHLVARGQTAHAAVTDGDQELFGGHARVRQHFQAGFVHADAAGIESRMRVDHRRHGIALHLRGLAEQQIHRHVDGAVLRGDGIHVAAFGAVGHDQAFFVGGDADRRERAAFAFAQGAEFGQMLRRDAEHITFLRFIAPQLHRRQRGIIAGHFAQIDDAALVGIVQQFRDGVRQTAGTDVVHEADRVGRAAREAAVDYFLATPLHFRVVALHRGEIERFRTLPGRHRRGSAAPETNQHGRTTEHDDDVAVAHRQFLHLARIDRAQAAGQHDRFVVGAHVRGIAAGQFEAAEVAGEVRSAEFVVERGAAERAVGHDFEGRSHARIQRARRLPGLRQGRNAQMRDRESGQAGFRFAAAAGRAFVADFAAGTGGRAGERRDGGRVVVGFDLDAERAGGGVAEAVGAGVIGAQMAGHVAFDDCGIVFVGTQRVLRREFVRVADHAEQAVRHVAAIDAVGGVEDLVPAVLGVGLREHHQFGIGRIAAERAVAFLQIRHFVFAQGQTEIGIGLRQLGDRHALQRSAHRSSEQRAGLLEAGAHALGHRIGK